MSVNETKIEELEQHDFYDDEYIDQHEKDLAPVIGQFLINFSRFEHSINTSLSDIISSASHDQGYLIIKDLDLSEKVRILKDLVAHHIKVMGSTRLKDFKTLCKRIVNCMEFRNKIAHANWNTLDKDGFVRVKIVSGRDTGYVTFQKEKLTPKAIFDATEELGNVEDDLFELFEEEGLA